MNGRLVAGHVEAAAERLAVDGDELPVADFVQRGDPPQQTLFELPGLISAKIALTRSCEGMPALKSRKHAEIDRYAYPAKYEPGKPYAYEAEGIEATLPEWSRLKVAE